MLALVATFGPAACGFKGEVLEGDDLVVLKGATLIDGTGGQPRPGSVVVVGGKRIVAVGRAGQFRYPAGAEVVDASGRYLVPGFMDLHVHLANGGDPEITRHVLMTLLAHGITTIFSPGGATEHAVAVRDSVAAGRIVGPRMLTAGTILYRQVNSPADVRAEVSRQAAAGVDYVKLYRSLTADMTRAGIEEAHARGIKALAHTSATSWLDAAEAGVDMLVHAGPGLSSLMTPQQRTEYVAYGDRIQRSYIPFEWIKPNRGDPALQALAGSLTTRSLAVEPTLVVYETMFWADSPGYAAQVEALNVHERVLERWRRQPLTADWSEEDFRRAKAAWPAALEFTRLLFENGVLLVSGTDVGVGGVIPGESFHRNLELLVAAGIPPSEVLRIGTRNGARALGTLEETGTVEAGKLADLVLLRGDPTTNISNTRQIEWVMRQGVRYRPSELLDRRFPLVADTSLHSTAVVGGVATDSTRSSLQPGSQ